MKKKKGECCPKFNPKIWDKKTFEWKNKLFIMNSMPTLFHMPFLFLINKKMTNLFDTAKKAKAMDSKKENILVLFHDPHAFKSEIMLSVNKKVKDANNISLSGTFEAMVFDGPYNGIPKFMKKMNAYLKKKKLKAEPKDYYVHYAYCPGCAKKYGHNYMILFAKVK